MFGITAWNLSPYCQKNGSFFTDNYQRKSSDLRKKKSPNYIYIVGACLIGEVTPPCILCRSQNKSFPPDFQFELGKYLYRRTRTINSIFPKYS